MLRRRFISLATLLFALAMPAAAVARSQDATLRIGVPQDVASDLTSFLAGRKLTDISDWSGPHARRDVVELGLLLQTIAIHLPGTRAELVIMDAYERLLYELGSGNLSLIGTSAWRDDLMRYGDAVEFSAPLIEAGQFRVGIYTSPTNVRALKARKRADLKSLTAVSNSQWTVDWRTLQNLGVARIENVRVWPSMVKMVANQRADFLLAPFPPGNDLSLRVEQVTLVPVKGLAVSLIGTRHFALSKQGDDGRGLHRTLLLALERRIKNGDFRRAYIQCGFINQPTKHWVTLNSPG